MLGEGALQQGHAGLASGEQHLVAVIVDPIADLGIAGEAKFVIVVAVSVPHGHPIAILVREIGVDRKQTDFLEGRVAIRIFEADESIKQFIPAASGFGLMLSPLTLSFINNLRMRIASVFSMKGAYLARPGMTSQALRRDSLPCCEILKGDSSNSTSL